MPTSPAVRSVSDLRARLAALPVDPAPLRRAGLLAALLVALLVAGKVLSPATPMASERYETPAAAEEVSAARAAAPPASRAVAARAAATRPMWTSGRVLAIVLLAAGGAGALLLRRKAPGGRASAGSIEVLGTHTLAPGQTLRLVACGDDVLLLGAASEGIRLLRHWPRASFERGTLTAGPLSFAAVLSTAAETPEDEAPGIPDAAAWAPDVLTLAEVRPAETLLAEVLPAEAPQPTPALFPVPAPRQFHVAHA